MLAAVPVTCPGICCCRKDFMFGAMAICMSGRYRDNEDMGGTFVYTGAGGQDKGNKQVRFADGNNVLSSIQLLTAP